MSRYCFEQILLSVKNEQRNQLQVLKTFQSGTVQYAIWKGAVNTLLSYQTLKDTQTRKWWLPLPNTMKLIFTFPYFLQYKRRIFHEQWNVFHANQTHFPWAWNVVLLQDLIIWDGAGELSWDYVIRSEALTIRLITTWKIFLCKWETLGFTKSSCAASLSSTQLFSVG